MKSETARREIESLDYYLQNHTNDYSEESHTAMMMAIDVLSSSEKPNKWIPVSERMPKYNTPVLLALKQIGKERAIVIGERRTRKSGWYFVDIAAYDTEHEVIAWMPLPEPYREERTEE